jgi:hypothetical protein
MERNGLATIAAKILTISDLQWCRRRGSNPHGRKGRGILSSADTLAPSVTKCRKWHQPCSLRGPEDSHIDRSRHLVSSSSAKAQPKQIPSASTWAQSCKAVCAARPRSYCKVRTDAGQPRDHRRQHPEGRETGLSPAPPEAGLTESKNCRFPMMDIDP